MPEKIERIMTCEICECKFIIDIDDIYKTREMRTMGNFVIPSRKYVMGAVQCPCCKRDVWVDDMSYFGTGYIKKGAKKVNGKI